MDSQLLVRIYNVGLGDCIYLRVPDRNRDVHILIDCGNKFGELELLGRHISELREELPDAGANKKRLDLLVVTHPHEDHHKGFEQEFFKDIKIERIWLSPAFDRQNPKAQGFRALQAAAGRALQGLSEVALDKVKKAEVDELLSLTKEEAIDMLCNTLPQANGIQSLFVSADTPPEDIQVFDDPAIKFKVLGPMRDIDAYYLGGAGLLNTVSAMTSQGVVDDYAAFFQAPDAVEVKPPKNISSQDFDLLRNHVQANALAVVEMASRIVNNLSVVLLLEWHGRRLLFPGDAEWSGVAKSQVRKDASNGSWNVMWQERRADLSESLDFLKIGHHGSENATPWAPPLKTGKPHPISEILDALLPRPKGNQQPKAQAVASTRRTQSWPSIPDPTLMTEIGRRIANARTNYREGHERTLVSDNTPQPPRTDLEMQMTARAPEPVSCIEIKFDRGDGS